MNDVVVPDDEWVFLAMTACDVTWKNGVVALPMGQYSAIECFPADGQRMSLGRFADGGAGIVFGEGARGERRGCSGTGDLAIWDDACTEPLRRPADMVRASGAVLAIQLMHFGHKARQKVPYATAMKRETGVLATAAEFIVHVEQTEAIPSRLDADMVARARELFYSPNWPTDAAQKLCVDPPFSVTRRPPLAGPPRRNDAGPGSFHLRPRTRRTRLARPDTPVRGFSTTANRAQRVIGVTA
jgi:2,4-dienoyl-CoA reductase-like NADH-dependent reductase (Old Yellow Enzyme family)